MFWIICIIHFIISALTVNAIFFFKDYELIQMLILSYGFVVSGVIWSMLTNYALRIKNYSKFIVLIFAAAIISEHIIFYILPLSSETLYWFRALSLLGSISQLIIYFISLCLKFIIRKSNTFIYICLLIMPILIFALFQLEIIINAELVHTLMVGAVNLGGGALYYWYIGEKRQEKFKYSRILSVFATAILMFIYGINSLLFNTLNVICFNIALYLIILFVIPKINLVQPRIF